MSDFALTAFPNPAEDRITIAVTQRAAGAQITFIYITGKAVKTMNVDADTIKVDIETLNSGIYFIRYEDSINVQTIKINK